MSPSQNSPTRAVAAHLVVWSLINVWGPLMGGLLIASPAAAQVRPTPAPLPIEVSGATRLEYNDSTGILQAEGAPVSVTRGRTVVRASRIRYDARARTIVASGGVELTDPGLSLRADDAEFRLSDDRVRANGNVVMRTVRDDETTVLRAPEVEGSLQTRRFVATDRVSVMRGEWTATGRRLDYDDGLQVAVISGEAEARYKDATMAAEVITFFVAREMVRAEGAVRLRRGDLTGTAPRVDVAVRDGRAVLSGGAQVTRGRDRLTAEVIEVDLDGSRVTARGTPRLIVVPPDR